MFLTSLRRRLQLRFKARAARRLAGRAFEVLRYAGVRSTGRHRFVVVSAERHAGADATRCLESVRSQRYDPDQVRHIFVDDASTDDTNAHIERWLRDHPDHRVEYRHNTERLGGTRNNLDGMRLARPGEIVIELNGDDWLPDPGVFEFLDRVYSDPGVWMTYNTMRMSNGIIGQGGPLPARVARENSFRAHPWTTVHLHSFRMELLAHLPEACMIDPQTNEYWANADDQALYLSLLELCGERARHVWRVTYVYNVRGESEFVLDGDAQFARARRIRELPPLKRLAALDAPPVAQAVGTAPPDPRPEKVRSH